MLEQVADLSNLVKIALVNDGKPDLDNWLANQLLQNKAEILKKGCLLDYSTESNYYLKNIKDTNDIFTSIHKILEKTQIPADLVHFCTGNLLNKENYNTPIMGANDGASGVAVLMSLAEILYSNPLNNIGVDLLFVDGEDMGRHGDLEHFSVGTKLFC